MTDPRLFPAASERWVGVTEAARLEAEAGRPVNKSSISRFLVRNEDVPRRLDAAGRVVEVEYGALARARASSLSVQDSHAIAPPAPARGAPVTAPPSRKRELEERKLELDLAEREGDVLDRKSVTMALEAIAVTMTQALERRRRKLATDMVALGDVRAGELALKAADTALLTGLVAKLTELAGDMVSGAAAEDEKAAA